jgi:hypothetical protein
VFPGVQYSTAFGTGFFVLLAVTSNVALWSDLLVDACLAMGDQNLIGQEDVV